MFRKRIPLLFVSISVLLASCNSGDIPFGPDSPMVIGISSGDVSFNITENSTNETVGTMKFLPLTEQTISIRFDFIRDFRDSFVFTYESDLFCIARRCEENESIELDKKLIGIYPYVETKRSLHGKLSKITFEGGVKSITEGRADIERIAINGSGKLTFEYEGAAFDPSKHFYVCEGLSFIPGGFSLRNDGGGKVGANCHEWYYFSDSDVLKD